MNDVLLRNECRFVAAEKLIRLFLKNPNKVYRVNSLNSLTGENGRMVRMILKELVSLGFVIRWRYKQGCVYQLTENYINNKVY